MLENIEKNDVKSNQIKQKPKDAMNITRICTSISKPTETKCILKTD